MLADTNAAIHKSVAPAVSASPGNPVSQETASSPKSSKCPPPSGTNSISDGGSRKKKVQRGVASWYGKKLHGRRAASGERFNMYAMTAAHPSLPLHSWILVRNLSNGKMAILKVNDRGPFHSKRILDVSYSAAKQLGFANKGTTRVEIRTLSRSEMPLVKAQIEQGIRPSQADARCDPSR